MMRNRDNWFSLSIVALFLLAICVPLAGAILSEDRGLSYSEKRKLRQLPELPQKLSGLSKYLDEFEQYYNDQFGLREFFLDGYSKTKKLLGDHDISSAAANVGTKNIIKGKNGWFFLNRKWDGDPVADYQNIHLYSDSALLRATLLFAARADWLKDRGIEYLIFFAPNKHTIYSEYLPDYIKKTGDISSLDQLNDALQRYTSVNFVDLRSVLLQGKNDASRYWRDRKHEAALYYKKDSHWNGAGADIAQYAVARKLEKLFPGRIAAGKRDVGDFVMTRFTGDITLIMGRKDKDAYGPALQGGTCTDHSITDYLQRHHVTECPRNSIDALVFYDSFLPPLKPYFTDYFRRTTYHWERMTRTRVEKEMKVTVPHIVIEERAERHLPFTPEAGNENYSSFWQKYWDKWGRTIFQLDLKKAGKGEYRSYNLDLNYKGRKEGVLLKALTFDPHLYLPKVDFRQDKLYMIQVRLSSESATELQFYFSSIGKLQKYPSEPYSITVPINKGDNTICVPLFSMDLAGGLRIDPGKKKGNYYIQQLEIKEVDWVNMK